MQELNRAFEILGDKDKRKRYDLGETDFPIDSSDYEYSDDIEDLEEKLRRKEEELRRTQSEAIDIEIEIIYLEKKAADRILTLNEIGAAFDFTFPKVNKEDLDPSL